MMDSYELYKWKIIKRLIILGKAPASLRCAFKQGKLNVEEFIKLLAKEDNLDVIRAIDKDMQKFKTSVTMFNTLEKMFTGKLLEGESLTKAAKIAYLGIFCNFDRIKNKSIRKPKINATQAQPKRYVRTKR